MFIKRGILQIVLAALLLTAQHAALTHQVWHLHDSVPLQSHQYDTGAYDPHSASCDFHIAFDEVLGAVSSFSFSLPCPDNAVERSIAQFSYTFPTEFIVPASRGPPVYL